MQFGNKSVIDELKQQFQHGEMTIKLIFANVILFLFGWLLEIIEWAFRLPDDYLINFLQEWTWLSSDLSEFAFTFYTIITYQFLHSGFWHILMNMIVLYWFGKIVSGYIGVRKILPLYLMGGIAGGLTYLLTYNLVPVFQPDIGVPLVGASASVMAILIVAARLAPEMEIRLFFVLKLKLKWLAFGLIILNIFTMQTGGNAGGNLSHLGGAAFGFLFLYLIQEHGIDLSKPWNQLFDYIARLFERTPKPRVTFRNTKPVKKTKAAKTEVEQEKVDAILDKIATNGYDSLSKAEKEYLFKASKE